jgi:hypothetical protein
MTIKGMRKQGLRLPARYRFLTNESGSVLMEFSVALISKSTRQGWRQLTKERHESCCESIPKTEGLFT